MYLVLFERSDTEIRIALFAHILFLQIVKDSKPAKKDSMHAASREILQKELEHMFFKNETQLTVTDPDGKNYRPLTRLCEPRLSLACVTCWGRTWNVRIWVALKW